MACRKDIGNRVAVKEAPNGTASTLTYPGEYFVSSPGIDLL
jgi:hypothetical protein